MGTHHEPFVALAAGAAALAEAFAEAYLQGPPPADAAATARVLAAVQGGLAAFSDVAFATGAVGLQSSGLWLAANVRLLAALNRDLSRFELHRLHQWPQLVGDYVAHGNRDDIVRRLVGVLDATCWPLRPSEKEFASIEANLNRYVRRAARDPVSAVAVERGEDRLVFGVAMVPVAPAAAAAASGTSQPSAKRSAR